MKQARVLFSSLLILLAARGPSGAESPALIRDLNSEAAAAFSADPSSMTFFRGHLYFWRTDPVSGRELWRIPAGAHSSAGAEAAELVRDICQEGENAGCSPRHRLLIRYTEALGDVLLFQACDSARGCQLWRTDGAPEGTWIVETFGAPDALDPPLFAHPLVSWNGAVYFQAGHNTFGFELFRTDGTASGTRLVKNIGPGREAARITSIVAAESRLFLLLGRELWTSDGTPPGTRKFELYTELQGVSTDQSAQGRLLFTRRGDTKEVWATDGSPLGTERLCQSCDFAESHSVGDDLFFFSHGSGLELWRTDGTPSGTIRVRQGLPVPRGGEPPGPVVSIGETLYFALSEELWRYDGTNVAKVADLGPFRRLVATDSYLLLLKGGEIWKSNGSDAFQLAAEYSGTMFQETAFADQLAFEIEDIHRRSELGIFDAVTDSIVLTQTHDPGSGRPESLTDDGSRLLFVANRALSTRGRSALYRSRGSEADTERLAPVSSDAKIVRVGETSFLFSDGLWVLNAEDEPVPLLDSDPGVEPRGELSVAIGNRIYFIASSRGGPVYQLWRSDGTRAGTEKLAEARTELSYCFTSREGRCRIEDIGIAALGNRVLVAHSELGLFRADSASGTFKPLLEPFQLDGCVGPPAFCHLDNLTRAGGQVFFTLAGNQEPLSLWRSDGTAQGTRRVRELHPPPSESYFYRDILDGTLFRSRPVRELNAVGGRLFFVLQDATFGEELWTSDGTSSGTVLVKDVRLGSASSFPRNLFAFNGRLAFGADDGVSGHELWTSDGTAAGTVRVADIYPGRSSSFPGHFSDIDGVLVFAADDGVTGFEPWRSDLTAPGTWRVADVASGRASSTPREFTASGSQVFMNAATAQTGFELFAVPRSALEDEPCSSCLLGGSFDVRVDWVDPNGVHGVGRAEAYDDNNVFFWFFSPNNLELLVKVLDGRALNDHFWVFYGALSNVEYTITVESRLTGEVRTYHNPAGNICGDGDVQAFFDGGDGLAVAAAAVGSAFDATPTPAVPPAVAEPRKGACDGGDQALCVGAGRFRVEVKWTDPNGLNGVGHALTLNEDSGAFWFFDPANLELMVKVLDGRHINGRFWFFFGGLSAVEYTITVTDTETGAQRSYHNAAGEVCGRGDTEAF